MPRVAVIGLGSIGQRHIANLIELGYTDIIGMDVKPFTNETRFPVVSTIEQVLAFNPTHALVCSPPDYHYWHAAGLMRNGRCHTFVEKPMTIDSLTSGVLVQAAQDLKLNLAVGYMERLHPTVQAAKAYALAHTIDEAIIQCFWTREGKSYESSVEAESSHAIDLALYLCGPIKNVEQVYRTRTGRVTAILRHESGTRSEVDMDERSATHRGVILSGAGDFELFDRSYGAVRAQWDQCYREELVAFIMGQPACTGRDGLAVMEVLEQIRRVG